MNYKNVEILTSLNMETDASLDDDHSRRSGEAFKSDFLRSSDSSLESKPSTGMYRYVRFASFFSAKNNCFQSIKSWVPKCKKKMRHCRRKVCRCWRHDYVPNILKALVSVLLVLTIVSFLLYETTFVHTYKDKENLQFKISKDFPMSCNDNSSMQ